MTISFTDAFFNLRYFFQKHYIKPEDVQVTFTFKDQMDYCRYLQGCAEDVPFQMNLKPGALNTPDPRKLVGINIKAGVAKPEKDGKEFSVDVDFETVNFAGINQAIKDGIAALDRVDARVDNIQIITREHLLYHSQSWYFLHLHGTRI